MNMFKFLAKIGALIVAIAALLSCIFYYIPGLNQISSGTVPSMAGGSKSMPTFTANYTGETPEMKNDKYLCSDALAIEKHASHLYDTCVFEFADENVRKVLNHIQKEEQDHGKMLYDYMSVNGMYCAS